MVVLEGERDDVPVGVLIGVIPRGSIFHWACGGYVYLLHHLGLADVPGSIQPVHQLEAEKYQNLVPAPPFLLSHRPAYPPDSFRNQ